MVSEDSHLVSPVRMVAMMECPGTQKSAMPIPATLAATCPGCVRARRAVHDGAFWAFKALPEAWPGFRQLAWVCTHYVNAFHTACNHVLVTISSEVDAVLCCGRAQCMEPGGCVCCADAVCHAAAVKYLEVSKTGCNQVTYYCFAQVRVTSLSLWV
jgi:hypothetical protein